MSHPNKALAYFIVFIFEFIIIGSLLVYNSVCINKKSDTTKDCSTSVMFIGAGMAGSALFFALLLFWKDFRKNMIPHKYIVIVVAIVLNIILGSMIVHQTSCVNSDENKNTDCINAIKWLGINMLIFSSLVMLCCILESTLKENNTSMDLRSGLGSGLRRVGRSVGRGLAGVRQRVGSAVREGTSGVRAALDARNQAAMHEAAAEAAVRRR